MSFNSQFLRVRRFCVYIPMLVDIERDTVRNKKEIISRIKNVIGDERQVCEEICQWVEFLYSIDQRISYWDIDMSQYIGDMDRLWTDEEKEKLRMIHDKIFHCVDEKEKEEYEKQKEKLFRAKQIELRCLQLEYLDKYKELYSNHRYG